MLIVKVALDLKAMEGSFAREGVGMPCWEPPYRFRTKASYIPLECLIYVTPKDQIKSLFCLAKRADWNTESMQ